MSNKKKGGDSSSAPLRSRTFTFELYPEWSYFTQIIAYMQKFQYAMILHDKDTHEDTGELKKPHVHVVLKYGGRRTLSSVQNEYKKLNLEKRFCDTCNERAMLRYLIHLDDPDKYQYPKTQVETNMKPACESAWNDEITSDEAFMLLNDYIEQSQEYIKQTDINKYAIKNGLLKGLKAYSSQINNARVEHNQAYLTNTKVSDLVDREQVKEHVKEHNRYKQAEKLVDEFGAVTIEDNGKTYTLTNAKVKTPQNEDKTDIWDGLDMVPNTSGGKNNGKA